MKNTDIFFDSNFKEKEQLPRTFSVTFDSVKVENGFQTKITVDGVQAGDIINDNARETDFYRFHDVFHYTFAAMLGWSPCTRSMIKRKRKSDATTDQVEDGARATITEEAISLLILNKAKKESFYAGRNKISRSLLTQIKEMTEPFEVVNRSRSDWENAILKGYSLFRDLVNNNGGTIHFDMVNRNGVFEKVSN